MRSKQVFIRRFCLSAAIFLFACIVPNDSFSQKIKRTDAVIINFDNKGRQVTRFSTIGDAIDAHDGEIALFNNTYYLYGTSYDCGFQWGNKSAPFCGFKVYSSKDMVNWTDDGYLFDAKTPVWQTRCNGNTYGCFRPHVIFNEKTKLYVLWINVYDNVSGYRVFTSQTPVGPFTEVAEPKLAVNADAPAAGLNNGDHDTFIDDDGTAYLAYTDWRKNGAIVVEKLSADYLTGTGEHADAVTTSRTEAPGMFKRNGIYYIVYSDPNCGYCSGTGTSYKTAKAPLGPWSEGKKISDNSCGGQPSFVSTIKLDKGTVFLFGSDLWNNAAKNEALANYYWAPLSFTEDGAIVSMTCEQSFKIIGSKIQTVSVAADQEWFKGASDISKGLQRSQSFTATNGGTLKAIDLTLYKTGYPNAGLQVEIYKAGRMGKPTGNALATATIQSDIIGWSARKHKVKLPTSLKKAISYCIVLRSETTTGSYGFTYGNNDNKDVFAKKENDSFKPENDKRLKFAIVMAR